MGVTSTHPHMLFCEHIDIKKSAPIVAKDKRGGCLPVPPPMQAR